MAQEIRDQDFEAEVTNSNIPVLVDFWAEWCGPCRQLSSTIEEFSKEYSGRLKVVKVNIDKNPVSPTKLGVRGIPTLMIFKGGKAISTKVGALPKSSLSEWIDDNI